MFGKPIFMLNRVNAPKNVYLYTVSYSKAFVGRGYEKMPFFGKMLHLVWSVEIGKQIPKRNKIWWRIINIGSF